ncbi:MFS general substrate transporter [Aspergillus sclerotiicarbonarius CBS 121057]|uniref:MFS general substrate transporter n=1 Tax=Aspergillus sclerotiicarbonarius (strain CBS 121057 / IBT 28362) TaxID=1448318 RepID=A0A319FIE9_ASPSB|nr:MFS general substrate transporter [Aspergillus sclerotiicarbonarius CBS 121057]
MRDNHPDDTLSVVSRVVTAEAHQQSLGILEPVAPDLSKAKQYTITCLILICNFIQFISMFSTVAGGFAFSAKLGHEAKPGQANWMAAAYSLTQSAFVLITGRLGAIYGHQKLLLLGVFIITVFSLCNAFCNTYVSFVAVRALTGIGGGIIMPNAVATLTIMVPPGKARNITLATFAATPPVGALVGALLAGTFLQYTEWKWHFILIACLGVPVLAGLFFVLPHEEPVDKGGKVDVIGAFLGLSGLLLFNIAWNQAPSTGWQTPYVIVILILSVLLVISFFIWESRFADEPIMPLAVFTAPSFNALIFVVLFIYMSVGISLWYMVAWQQLLRGWTVLHVAIGWIPYGIGASVAVTLAAWLITVLEAQYILSLGCLTSIVACVLLATMPEQQIYWAQVFPATVIGSLCPDFVYVAAQIIASNSVGKREQGVASSLIGTLNLYGNSLGLGFAGTVEVQVAKNTNSEVSGIRAGLWFGAALGIMALLIDLAFVRMRQQSISSNDVTEVTEVTET